MSSAIATADYPYPGEEFAPVERRAVRASDAQDLTRALAEMFGSGSRVQGELSVDQQTRGFWGWVSVAVRRKRESVASFPFRVYQSAANGKRPDEITAFDHPLVKLFRQPHKDFTRSRFWARTITFLELTGNAIWIKQRPSYGGRKLAPPTSLATVPSQFIRKWTDNDEKFGWYLINGAVWVPPWDVVHHMYDNPEDQNWGIGTLAAAARSLRSQEAISNAQLASFSNDIMSSLYFHTKGELNTPQWQRMMAQLRQRYGGVKNAGTPLLLEGDVQVENLHRSPKEMNFLESSELVRDEILSVFGVPPILAGIVKDANRANSKDQIAIFERYQIWPMCVGIQEQVNKDLTPEFGDNLEVAFDPPAVDAREKAEVDRLKIEAGTRTINEVREEEGDPPIEGCDRPKFMVEAEIKAKAAPQFGEADAQGSAEPVTEDTDEGSSEEDAGTLRVGRPPVTRESGGNTGPAARRLPIPNRRNIVQRGILIRSANTDFDRLEDQTIPPLRKFFAAQAKRIKARLPEIFGDLSDRAVVGEWRRIYCVTAKSPMLGRLFADGTTVQHTTRDGFAQLRQFVTPPGCCYGDGQWSKVQVRKLQEAEEQQLDDWEAAAERLAETMLPRLEGALVLGSEFQAAQLGLEAAFDLKGEQAVAWLKAKQRDYWLETVNQTTRTLLSEKLSEVLLDAPTMPKLEAAVEEVMAGRIQSSAKVIARTETVGAWNGGANILRDEHGINEEEWFSTIDERTRATHFAADGQISKDGKFTVGGATLDYPGDPSAPLREICCCRCFAAAVID